MIKMENKFKVFDKLNDTIYNLTKINYSDETFEPISVQMISSDGIKIYRNISNVILIQYTGQHDKNHIEIYNGNILKYPKHDEPYEIFWDKETAGFVCENSNNFMLPVVWKQMTIVGHIYENPELLY